MVGDEKYIGDAFNRCFWLGPFTVFLFLYVSSRISLSMFSLGSSRGILFGYVSSLEAKLKSSLLFLSWSTDITFLRELSFLNSDFDLVMLLKLR